MAAYFQESNAFCQYQSHELSSFSYSRNDAMLDIGNWNINMDPLFPQTDAGENLSWDEEPMQRYLQHSEKLLFSPTNNNFQPQPFHIQANRPYDAPEALPRPMTSESPLTSPEQFSECSTTSPGNEHEWTTDSQLHFSVESTSFSYTPNANDSFWPVLQSQTPPQHHQQHISMNVVQSFDDSQDLFQDEGLGDEVNFSFSQDVEAESTKPIVYSRDTRQLTDEAVGKSIKEESECESESKTIIKDNADLVEDEDADADADSDDEDTIAVEPVDPQIEDSGEDEDYKPSSQRVSNRKRVLPRAFSSSPTSKKVKRDTKRARGKPKSALTCQDCEWTAKDTHSLQSHSEAKHTRPFICTFAFAGCDAVFRSKNEWKRHVTSQHLALTYWRCEEGTCGQAKDTNNKTRIGQEFNRKDLFTQHLRRMHAPFAVKRQKKTIPEWENKVKLLQAKCLRTRREAPHKAICPMDGCTGKFQGKGAWDERMEHVGKHLEATRADIAGSRDVLIERGDEVLLKYAIDEGIVERIAGKYVLVGAGAVAAAGDEEDAPGEEE